MKDKNSKIMFLTACAVAIIVIVSIGSLGNSTRNNDNKANVSGVALSTNARARIVSLNSYDVSSTDVTFDGSDNIVVANATGNESYPSMVISGYKALVGYDYEFENKTHVYFRNSLNFGQRWSSGYATFDLDLNTSSPSLSIQSYPGKTAYCAAISDYNNSALIYDIQFPDITDINSMRVSSVDWSNYGFWNFSRPDIIYYSDPIYPNDPFVTGVIGSTTYTDPSGQGAANDTIMFFYINATDPTYYEIAWDASVQNCSNISMSLNSSSKNIYGVCEIKNGTKQDLLVFYDNPLKWNTTSTLQYKILSETESMVHPQIFFTNSQIYIVAETNTNGIILYNSSDSGTSWSLNNVTKDILPVDAKPVAPRIYVNSNEIFCIFTDHNNISITNSTDNGISWSTPTQLNSQNGSVVENYRFSDFPDNDHVLWTDIREGSSDIYSNIRALPAVDMMIIPESVNISTSGIQFIPTKNYITFTVRNNGNAFIENVPVKITYNTGNKTKSTSYPAYILFLDGSGAERSFTQPLFRLTLKEFIKALISFAGVQNITVTVDPEHIYDDSNPIDNSVTIPVLYSDIFPNLSFLEKIFAPSK